MKKTKKLWMLLPAAAAAALLLMALTREGCTFCTARAQKRDIVSSVLTLGTAAPSNYRPIINPSDEYVEKIYVKAGDTVKKGDVLYTLSHDALDARREALLSSGGSAEDILAIDGMLSKCSVTAPSDGEVLDISVFEGSPAGAGLTSMTLGDTSRPTVSIALSGEDAYSVCEGMRVIMKADGMDGSFTGSISKAARYFTRNPETGLFERAFTVNFDDPPKALLTGAAVECEIILQQAEGAVTVPISAVASDGEAYIYVDSGGSAEKRYVRLLLHNGEYAAVEGVSEGEYVVKDIKAYSEKK